MSFLSRITSLFRSPAPSTIPTLQSTRATMASELTKAKRAAADAAKKEAAARKTADEAASVEAEARAKVERLVEEGADDGAVDEVQRAAERARLRRVPVVRRFEEATSAREAADAHAATLESEIAAIDTSVVRAKDNEEASVSTYYAKAGPHFEKLVEAIKAVREHAAAIDGIYDESCAAAARCRSAGADMPNLHRYHQLIPLLDGVERTPNRDPFRQACWSLEPGLNGRPGGLERVLFSNAGGEGLGWITSIDDVPENQREQRQRELSVFVRCRTSMEAEQLVTEEETERKRAEAEAHNRDPKVIAARATHKEGQEALRMRHGGIGLA